MSERSNPQKRANQTKRAQALSETLYEFVSEQHGGDVHDGDPELTLRFARQLSHQQWCDLAETRLGWERLPSTETVAMAIAMIETRTNCDRIYDRRNHGNQKVWMGFPQEPTR